MDRWILLCMNVEVLRASLLFASFQDSFGIFPYNIVPLSHFSRGSSALCFSPFFLFDVMSVRRHWTKQEKTIRLQRIKQYTSQNCWMKYENTLLIFQLFHYCYFFFLALDFLNRTTNWEDPSQFRKNVFDGMMIGRSVLI